MQLEKSRSQKVLYWNILLSYFNWTLSNSVKNFPTETVTFQKKLSVFLTTFSNYLLAFAEMNIFKNDPVSLNPNPIFLNNLFLCIHEWVLFADGLSHQIIRI